jgi:hypothetical protein
MNRLAWVCIIAFAAVAHAEGPKLPGPPEGFSWKRVEEIKASFLMPKGWHYRLDTKGKTTAAFITREKIEKGKPFLVGLSVNVVRDRMDPPAEKLARLIAEQFGKIGKVEDTVKVNRGKLKGSGGRLTVAGKNLTMQFLVLANTETNTLYIIQFESPEKEWKEAWKVGKAMMEKMALGDEVFGDKAPKSR